MKLHKYVSTLALVGVMAGTAPIAVVAQTQQSAPPVAEVTSSEVDAFVVAFKEVQAIDQEYVAQIQQTSDAAEIQTLEEEAQIKKAAAVDATSGIDVARYVEIMTIAQNDPDVSAVIVEKLEK